MNGYLRSNAVDECHALAAGICVNVVTTSEAISGSVGRRKEDTIFTFNWHQRLLEHNGRWAIVLQVGIELRELVHLESPGFERGTEERNALCFFCPVRNQFSNRKTSPRTSDPLRACLQNVDYAFSKRLSMSAIIVIWIIASLDLGLRS